MTSTKIDYKLMPKFNSNSENCRTRTRSKCFRTMKLVSLLVVSFIAVSHCVSLSEESKIPRAEFLQNVMMAASVEGKSNDETKKKVDHLCTCTGIKLLGTSISRSSKLDFATPLKCVQSLIDSSYKASIPRACMVEIKLNTRNSVLDALLQSFLWPVMEYEYEEPLKPGVRVMDFVMAYVKNRAEKCPEKKPLTENHFNCFREKLFNGFNIPAKESEFLEQAYKVLALEERICEKSTTTGAAP